MFGQLMHGVAQDFVRYIMRVQVVSSSQPQQAPAVQNVQTSAPAEADGESGMRRPRPGPSSPRGAAGGTPTRAVPDAAPAVNTPVVKSEWDKTPRNAPCPCGSGKKYKMCHGRT